MASILDGIRKGSFSLVNRILIFLFAFGSYLLLVRYLDKADFGVYSLYLVITTFVEMGRKAFLQNAFTKYFLDSDKHKGESIVASTVLNLIWTGTGSLILFSLSGVIAEMYNSEDLGSLMRIYSLVAFVQIPTTQVVVLLTAKSRFKLVSLLTNARSFFFFFCIGYVFLFQPGVSVFYIVLMNMAGIAFGALLSLFFMGQIWRSALRFNWSLIWEMFHFAKFTLGTGLTSLLTRSVDEIMIGYFVSLEGVASYNIAKRFLNIIDIPITSISHVAYPKMARAIKEDRGKDRVSAIYEKSAGYGIGTILPITLALLVFPAFFINIVAGPGYLDAIPALQILLLLTLLKPLAIQAGSMLEVLGKPRITFQLLMVNTLLNAGLNYYLINLQGSLGGIVGASLASFLARIIHLGFLFYFVSKESRVSFMSIAVHCADLYRTVLVMMRSKLLVRYK